MTHPHLRRWEKTLRDVLREIDAEIEQTYGDRYSLHPARPPHGTTANPQHDGLFSVNAVFSAGFGSEHGPGYLLRVQMATLDAVPAETRDAIERVVAKRLREALPRVFPGRTLHVERDGNAFKIHGDLSLGTA